MRRLLALLLLVLLALAPVLDRAVTQHATAAAGAGSTMVAMMTAPADAEHGMVPGDGGCCGAALAHPADLGHCSFGCAPATWVALPASSRHSLDFALPSEVSATATGRATPFRPPIG